MRRFVVLSAVVAAVAAAFLVPGRASADINGCPPTFSVSPAEPGVPSGFADRNGDRLVCSKAAGNRIVYIDNNVPSGTVQGLEDTGSAALVDTATGDVLPG